MTLGQKLAGYRKLSGMTQQQLGDRLSISAQAISKWEKDLSEPALATMRKLARIYNVTVDELLNLESGFSEKAVPQNAIKTESNQKKQRIVQTKDKEKKASLKSEKNSRKQRVASLFFILAIVLFAVAVSLIIIAII